MPWWNGSKASNSTHVLILCRDQASSASGNEAAASGMSSNERNQTHISACTLMSPPRASNVSSQVHANQSRDPAIHQLMFSFFVGIKPSVHLETKLQLLTHISARTLMSPPRASNVSSQVHANQRLFIEQSLANQTLEL
nr:rRNA-processing protein EFG1-like isoform X1 [Tanacetum cinerariifolium]